MNQLQLPLWSMGNIFLNVDDKVVSLILGLIVGRVAGQFILLIVGIDRFYDGWEWLCEKLFRRQS